MSLELIKESLPEYAKDIKLNLSSAFMQQNLTPTQLWGTAVAVAASTRSAQLIEWVYSEAREKLDEVNFTAARGAAALMAMNNTYYRTLHLAEEESLLKTPSGLRMNFMKSHGVDSKDFELWSLAVSAINACGLCISSHRNKLLESGITDDQILSAIKIAATLNAVAAILVESNCH
ncbi:MAG: carboxymuconolactone decarboxylase family protein [Bdellovibrionales bacterium]|nr:carboxymuconolactone decarboxylase family protein [Bdellovibrionales bacterium]